MQTIKEETKSYWKTCPTQRVLIRQINLMDFSSEGKRNLLFLVIHTDAQIFFSRMCFSDGTHIRGLHYLLRPWMKQVKKDMLDYVIKEKKKKKKDMLDYGVTRSIALNKVGERQDSQRLPYIDGISCDDGDVVDILYLQLQISFLCAFLLDGTGDFDGFFL